MPHISYPAKVVQEQLRTGTTNLKQVSQVTAKSVGNKTHIQTLFKRFHSAYGPCWTNRFESSAMAEAVLKEWVQDLASYNEAEVDRAFEACKKRYPLAPTLPQFLELCKMARDSKYVRPVEEGKPRSSAAFAQTYIEQMRQSVRQSGGGDVGNASHAQADSAVIETTTEGNSATNSASGEQECSDVALGWEACYSRCDGCGD